MSWASAIVLIVLIAAVASVLRARHESRGRGDGADLVDNRPEPSRREKELEREIEELRERLQVLERIATDGREAKAIAEEIESLREK